MANIMKRGVLRIHKATGNTSVNWAQEVPEIDAHFYSIVHAVAGSKTTMIGAWWGGSSNINIRHDYLSFFVSESNDGVDFGAEQQLSFADSPIADITVSYPSLIHTQGKIMVMCRLPQSSSNRTWGYKIADNYPFIAADFGQTYHFVEPGTRWYYIQPFIDTSDSSIVHFTFRAHGSHSGMQGDFSAYYGYADFNTGDFYGKNGVIGNLFTNTGLPITNMGDLWQIPVGDGVNPRPFPMRPMGKGAPTNENPVVIPFTDRDDTAYNVKVAVISGGVSPAIIDLQLLAGSGRSVSWHRGEWKRFLIQSPTNQLIEVRSQDNFLTFTTHNTGQTADISWAAEVIGSQGQYIGLYNVGDINNPQLYYVKEA